jgi:septal ring factor EnvC (AmiA/AmiB activator)
MSLENLSPEARDELAALAQRLADNPETRKDFLRMTKKVNPDLPIPELEIDDRTNSAINQMRQENDSIRAQLKAKEAQEMLDKRRQSLVKKGLVDNEDEIDAVEKLMLEKKIADHETAAQYHQWMKQAAVPTPSGYQPSAVKQFDLNKFWKNPANAAREEAVRALNDVRKPMRPIGL